jgi:GntR family transcriptional regulator
MIGHTRDFVKETSNFPTRSKEIMHIQPGLVPRYYQLKEILEKRIQLGEFQPDDQFPTDESLCEEYGLSRGTVRRAIDMLVEVGRLRREQGRGTFVTFPLLVPVFFRLSSFDEEMRQRGRTPATRLLDLKVVPASEPVAADLELALGEDVIEISRLRLADDIPMALETRYLAYKICPDLLHEDLEKQSIHSLLIDKYNIPLIRARHMIEARVLTSREAEVLLVRPGSAGFFVSRVTYTLSDRPVTRYHIVYRGDEYRFTAEF